MSVVLDKSCCILQDLHDSEINFHLSGFFDAGFDVRLGDDMNGYKCKGTADNPASAIEWLKIRAIEHYPNSLFAKTYRQANP